MLTLRKYRAKLAHDHGKVFITVWNHSEQNAIEQIMKAEGCPRNAIEEIKEIEINHIK